MTLQYCVHIFLIYDKTYVYWEDTVRFRCQSTCLKINNYTFIYQVYKVLWFLFASVELWTMCILEAIGGSSFEFLGTNYLLNKWCNNWIFTQSSFVRVFLKIQFKHVNMSHRCFVGVLCVMKKNNNKKNQGNRGLKSLIFIRTHLHLCRTVLTKEKLLRSWALCWQLQSKTAAVSLSPCHDLLWCNLFFFSFFCTCQENSLSK